MKLLVKKSSYHQLLNGASFERPLLLTVFEFGLMIVKFQFIELCANREEQRSTTPLDTHQTLFLP